MSEDDGYGRRWEYRVFSQQNTCPDDWNVGQRYLTVHQCTRSMTAWPGSPQYPLPDDYDYIEAEPAFPHGVGIEEALLDADRITKAFDRPVLIRAEFREHFEWSQKQNERNAVESVRLRGRLG